MLRTAVRDLLNDDGTLTALLTGGIYPTADSQASILTKQDHPAAFDSYGKVLPTALVQDDGVFPFPGTDRTVSALVRVLFWQQDGRDSLEAALRRTFDLLNGARVALSAGWVYQFAFAGESPTLRDPALGEAEHGWSRWQAVMLR